MPHPTLTDIRAALTCLDYDATVSEIGGFDDGSIEIYTTDADAPLLISRRRIDGQRWYVSTTRPAIDGWEPPTRRAHDIAECIGTIEDLGYGHIKAARIATDEAGVWRVWGPTAAAIAEILNVDCDSPKAAITALV